MNRETLARCPKYLDYIRSQRCVVTSIDVGVVAHHITVNAQRGISQKPSDFWCVPLHWDTHDKLHHFGEKAFWNGERMDPHAVAAKFLYAYILHHDGPLELLRHLNEFAAERYGK